MIVHVFLYIPLGARMHNDQDTPDPEKHQKFTQSKFDIFSYTSLFLAFTKEIVGKFKR